MRRQTLQGDPENHFAGPRRPAQTTLGRLEPFEETTNAEDHIAKPGAQVLEGGTHAVARRLRARRRAPRRTGRAAVLRGQKACPVLRDPRSHLRQLKVLAQTLSGVDEVGCQVRLTRLVTFAPQNGERTLREVVAHPLRRTVVTGHLTLVDDLVLRPER